MWYFYIFYPVFDKYFLEKLNVNFCSYESSQSPTNAVNIKCSPYKTYNYVRYIKI
jgi:lipid II:glycine glycyltransferase (peptidoglycan interpeptide bridge formation enzyme)